MQRDEHPGVRSKLLSSHQLARLHTFEAAARHGSFARRCCPNRYSLNGTN